MRGHTTYKFKRHKEHVSVLGGREKESCWACAGSISTTSIPGEGGWTVEDPGSLLGCERWTMAPVCAESRSHATAGSIRLPELVTIMPLLCDSLSFSTAFPCLLQFSLSLPFSPFRLSGLLLNLCSPASPGSSTWRPAVIHGRHLQTSSHSDCQYFYFVEEGVGVFQGLALWLWD